MGTSTPYVNLYKPATEGELVNVADLNENMDKVDAKFFDQNGRLNAVESLAGVSNDWSTDWAPAVKTAAGTSLARSLTSVEYLRLGSLVFFEVDLTITQATASHVGGPVIKLPFEAIRSVLHADATLVGGGFTKKLHCFLDGTDPTFMFTRYMQDDSGGGGEPLIVEPSGAFAYSLPVNSVFKASGWFRTSGVAVL